MRLQGSFQKTKHVKVSRLATCLCLTTLKRLVAGGSLGWKTRNSMLPEFESVAFELQPSTTNSPKWAEVKTSEGYHIIMVEGRK